MNKPVQATNCSTNARATSYFDLAARNPCDGCSAPCCRMLLVPLPTPATFMDLDHILFMLGFAGTEAILHSEGQWQLLVQRTCRFLDQETSLCTHHDTPRKPKTCAFFNCYQCWYKQNFSAETPVDLIRFDLEKFEAVLFQVQFDEDGRITQIPDWVSMQSVANNVNPQ